MYPLPAPTLVWIGIPAMALVVAVLFVVGVRRSGTALGLSRPLLNARTFGVILGLAVWTTAALLVAASGLMLRTDVDPPPFGMVFAMILAGAVTLGISRLAGSLARALPLAALVGFHAFRLPLGFVMHEAAAAGVMPPQMTWSGLNFDVVTGITAIGVALLLAIGKAPRALLWAWNVMGLALVLTVAVIGALSSPPIHAFGIDPLLVNSWVASVPFILLPSICVPAAIAGHIVIFRALLQKPVA